MKNSQKYYHFFRFSGDSTVYTAPRQMSAAELSKDPDCESTEIDMDLDAINLEDLLDDGQLCLIQQGTHREPAVYSDERPGGWELFKRLRAHVTALRGQVVTLTPALTRARLSALSADFRVLDRHIAAAKALRECVETWWAGREAEAVNVAEAHQFDGDIEAAEVLLAHYEAMRHEAERLQLASLAQLALSPVIQRQPLRYGVSA